MNEATSSRWLRLVLNYKNPVTDDIGDACKSILPGNAKHEAVD